MDRDRPVLIGHHLIGRFSCRDPASVCDLVLLVSRPVKILNCQVLEGNTLAVVDKIEDLACLFRVTGVYGGGTEIRDLAEHLAV